MPRRSNSAPRPMADQEGDRGGDPGEPLTGSSRRRRGRAVEAPLSASPSQLQEHIVRGRPAIVRILRQAHRDEAFERARRTGLRCSKARAGANAESRRSARLDSIPGTRAGPSPSRGPSRRTRRCPRARPRACLRVARAPCTAACRGWSPAWSVVPCRVSAPADRPTGLGVARPKSSSLAPAFVSITFAGFRSRCTMPAPWAHSRPSAIWLAHRIASDSGKGPRVNRSASVSPSSRSITRNATPS